MYLGMDLRCLARSCSSLVMSWAAVGSWGLCKIKKYGSHGVRSHSSSRSSSLGTIVGRRSFEMVRFRRLWLSAAMGSGIGSGDTWMSFITLDARFGGKEPMACDGCGVDGTLGVETCDRNLVMI